MSGRRYSEREKFRLGLAIDRANKVLVWYLHGGEPTGPVLLIHLLIYLKNQEHPENEIFCVNGTEKWEYVDAEVVEFLRNDCGIEEPPKRKKRKLVPLKLRPAAAMISTLPPPPRPAPVTMPAPLPAQRLPEPEPVAAEPAEPQQVPQYVPPTSASLPKDYWLRIFALVGLGPVLIVIAIVVSVDTKKREARMKEDAIAAEEAKEQAAQKERLANIDLWNVKVEAEAESEARKTTALRGMVLAPFDWHLAEIITRRWAVTMEESQARTTAPMISTPRPVSPARTAAATPIYFPITPAPSPVAARDWMWGTPRPSPTPAWVNSGSSKSSGGSVYVPGYTRKDGTYVRGYTRSK